MQTDIGVLLIHGFAGNRKEVYPLYKYLIKRGFCVLMPQLKGHGGTRKDLAKYKYTDWINCCEADLKYLTNNFNKVIAIGFSMGGLIGINLYHKYKIDGLIFINTPVRCWNFKKIFKNLKFDFKYYAKRYFNECINKPIRALLEFLKILCKTKAYIDGILCNVLVVQLADDDTVKPNSADYIYSRVGGIKEIKKYDIGGHIPFYTSTAEQIFNDIYRFIRNNF